MNGGRVKTLAVNGGEMRDVNVCRMVILGNTGVGKTALTVRFLTKRFIGEYCPTLESIYKYNTCVDDEEVRLEILDTAGQINEVHREGYAMWGDCFMFVYSITDRLSFQELASLKTYVENAKKSTSIVGMVVANKADLLYSRTVSCREGRDLAEDMACKFMEVSAADWTQVTCVTDMFLDLYREYRKTKITHSSRQRKTSSSQKFKQAIQKVISGKSSSSKKLSVYQ